MTGNSSSSKGNRKRQEQDHPSSGSSKKNKGKGRELPGPAPPSDYSSAEGQYGGPDLANPPRSVPATASPYHNQYPAYDKVPRLQNPDDVDHPLNPTRHPENFFQSGKTTSQGGSSKSTEEKYSDDVKKDQQDLSTLYKRQNAAMRSRQPPNVLAKIEREIEPQESKLDRSKQRLQDSRRN